MYLFGYNSQLHEKELSMISSNKFWSLFKFTWKHCKCVQSIEIVSSFEYLLIIICLLWGDVSMIDFRGRNTFWSSWPDHHQSANMWSTYYQVYNRFLLFSSFLRQAIYKCRTQEKNELYCVTYFHWSGDKKFEPDIYKPKNMVDSIRCSNSAISQIS